MLPAIVLFRHDLRLTDNPALVAAAKSKRPLILLYVYDEMMGSAQKWWLHEGLSKLPLVLRKGPLVPTVLKVAKEVKAEAIYWNRGYNADSIGVEFVVHLVYAP